MFILMNYPVDSTSRVHGLCWRVLVLAMAALMLCRRLPDP